MGNLWENKMKKLLMLLICASVLSAGNYFVDNFLKYSTFYASYSLNSPLKTNSQFEFTGDGIVDISKEIEYDYAYSVGIRKVARFKYELKSKKFYDGSEDTGNESANVGAVKGWEYLLKYSDARSFGQEYINTEAWLRYVGESFLVKAGYSEFGLEDLTFGQADVRYKKQFGKVILSTGIAFRGHPVVEIPFGLNWLDEFDGQWWQLAYTQGWTDELYLYDDYYYIYDYYWYNPDGELVCETDECFYNNYFDGIVNNYYLSQFVDRGWQWESSLALGLDVYHYTDSFWFHSWLSVYPYNYGLTEFSDAESREGEVDHDIGAILGLKVTKNFGLFVEGRHLSYFTLSAYDFKVGLNYTIF